jgi:hypothetical protein
MQTIVASQLKRQKSNPVLQNTVRVLLNGIRIILGKRLLFRKRMTNIEVLEIAYLWKETGIH